jgi:hypothetical protein
MNYQKLRVVRDAMAEHKQQIDMAEICVPANYKRNQTIGNAFKHCNTVGCIAGWTMAIFAPNTRMDANDILYQAQFELELEDGKEATHLFLGEWSDKDLAEITPEETIAHLDKLLAEEPADA